MIDDIEEEINIDESKYRTMEGVVHKCIRCDSTVFEIDNGVFTCPHCGFEWEIL